MGCRCAPSVAPASTYCAGMLAKLVHDLDWLCFRLRLSALQQG